MVVWKLDIEFIKKIKTSFDKGLKECSVLSDNYLAISLFLNIHKATGIIIII